MTEFFTNFQAGPFALTSPAGSGDPTIQVSNGANLPATGTFRLLLGTEIMIATARTAGVVSVTRGAEGTVAASYPSGQAVIPIVTAGALAQLEADCYTASLLENLRVVSGNVAANVGDYLLCDLTAGPCNVTLPILAFKQRVTVKAWKGNINTHPLSVYATAGTQQVENPSSLGTYVANPGPVSIPESSGTGGVGFSATFVGDGTNVFVA